MISHKMMTKNFVWKLWKKFWILKWAKMASAERDLASLRPQDSFSVYIILFFLSSLELICTCEFFQKAHSPCKLF